MDEEKDQAAAPTEGEQNNTENTVVAANAVSQPDGEAASE